MKQIAYQRLTRVVSRKVKNNLVLLDPKLGKILTFNETAAKLWCFLWKPRTVDEMEELLLKEYAVSKKRLKQDLNEFITKMTRLGLIKKKD